MPRIPHKVVELDGTWGMALSIRLQNGNRVCIIGGGPAGSFSAIHLLKLAQEHGLQLDVLIFEVRDPAGPGRESCKGCAGILSADLVNSLTSMGIVLHAAG